MIAESSNGQTVIIRCAGRDCHNRVYVPTSSTHHHDTTVTVKKSRFANADEQLSHRNPTEDDGIAAGSGHNTESEWTKTV